MNPDPAERALRPWRILIWAMLAAPVVVALATPRYFPAGHVLDLVGSYSALAKSEFGSSVYRLGMLALALTATGVIAVWGRRTPDGSRRALLWGGAALSGTLALSALLGSRPGFAPGLVVWPLLFVCLAVLPAPPSGQLFALLRRGLRALALLSIAFALLLPAWAFEREYASGWFQWWSWRLYGAMPHPNFLGPLMLLALLLELHLLCIARPAGLLARAAALAWPAAVLGVLLATQSKTTMLAAAIAVPLLLVLWANRAAGPRLDARIRLAAGAWGIAMLVCLAALFSGSLASWADDLADAKGDSVTTLTGRTVIWNITLDEWRRNPWFGDGPGLWDAEMQDRYEAELSWRTGHAHNQVVQQLGQSGVFGLLAWIAYLGVIVWTLWRSPPRHRPLGWSILAMIVLGTISEPWFSRGMPGWGPVLLLCHLALGAGSVSEDARCADASDGKVGDPPQPQALPGPPRIGTTLVDQPGR
ncbi:MAG TPA: hypothetical protein DCS97_01080 [Planctomycetes bacterium]|nr:hypothetical protein [Planctomycetota bacterium]